MSHHHGTVVTLTILSAALALAGIGFTVSGYVNAHRESKKRSTLADVERVRPLIADFVYGSKIWQAYLGTGLTALGVVVGAAAGLIGACAS